MSQAQLLPAVSPSVSIHNGRPATTSLEVARFFGKRHDHVLRSINDLIGNTPKEFTAPNFGVSEYTDESGRALPMFILYRDGFMLLVMGYTGKKAMEIKVAYILAFNKMEAQIAGKALPPSTAEPVMLTPPKPYCTDREMRPLHAAVNEWCRRKGVKRLDALEMVREHFGLNRFRPWPKDLYNDALAWIREQYVQKALPPDLPNLSYLPKTQVLLKDIQRAADALAPSENWAHIAVRFELGGAAENAAKHAVDLHVNAAWYAIGLARSSLMAAVAVGKIG